jgi:hypothetical protein
MGPKRNFPALLPGSNRADSDKKVEFSSLSRCSRLRNLAPFSASALCCGGKFGAVISRTPGRDLERTGSTHHRGTGDGRIPGRANQGLGVAGPEMNGAHRRVVAGPQSGERRPVVGIASPPPSIPCATGPSEVLREVLARSAATTRSDRRKRKAGASAARLWRVRPRRAARSPQARYRARDRRRKTASWTPPLATGRRLRDQTSRRAG